MKRRDFCKGLAVTLAAGALAPAAALPQADTVVAAGRGGYGAGRPGCARRLLYPVVPQRPQQRRPAARLLLQRQPVRPPCHRVRQPAGAGHLGHGDSHRLSVGERPALLDGRRGRSRRPYPGRLCKVGLYRGAAVQLYPQPERHPGHRGLCRCPQNAGARRQTGDYHRGVPARLRLWSRVVRQPSCRARQRPHRLCDGGAAAG